MLAIKYIFSNTSPLHQIPLLFFFYKNVSSLTIYFLLSSPLRQEFARKNFRHYVSYSAIIF